MQKLPRLHTIFLSLGLNSNLLSSAKSFPDDTAAHRELFQKLH